MPLRAGVGEHRCQPRQLRLGRVLVRVARGERAARVVDHDHPHRAARRRWSRTRSGCARPAPAARRGCRRSRCPPARRRAPNGAGKPANARWKTPAPSRRRRRRSRAPGRPAGRRRAEQLGVARAVGGAAGRSVDAGRRCRAAPAARRAAAQSRRPCAAPRSACGPGRSPAARGRRRRASHCGVAGDREARDRPGRHRHRLRAARGRAAAARRRRSGRPPPVCTRARIARPLRVARPTMPRPGGVGVAAPAADRPAVAGGVEQQRERPGRSSAGGRRREPANAVRCSSRQPLAVSRSR